ncbi:MAG: radical SAM protein [Deinococcales bacterium]
MGPALEALNEGQDHFWSLDFKDELHGYLTPGQRSAHQLFNHHAGCNHHCTYCIVPDTRGPEVSRSLESIMHEAIDMQQKGALEIYLLGQNVNSYGLGRDDLPSFAELLAKVAALGIPRVKFTTSHPMNFTSDIINVMVSYDNICNYIHLPVQSGSDRVFAPHGEGISS